MKKRDHILRAARIALLACGLLTGGCSKTIVERGDHEIGIEFEEPPTTSRTILYCNTESLSETNSPAFTAWAAAQQADLIAFCGPALLTPESGYRVEATQYTAFASKTDFGQTPEPLGERGALLAEFDGIRYVVATFDPDENGLAQLIKLLDAGYNDPNHAAERWFIGGSFYYYSMMETGYDTTPVWYPADTSSRESDADRYAWRNNLYDCIWMLHRDWTPTYTDRNGHTWRADYLYASRSAWNTISGVEILGAPVEGMLHKPIKFTIKY